MKQSSSKIICIMKAGHLNTQSEQVDWIYNQWNDINNGFIKILPNGDDSVIIFLFY